MNYNLNEEEKIFAEILKKAYHGRSFIRKLANFSYYSKNSSLNQPFIQITDGIRMEESMFSDNVSNAPIGSNLGESIAFGEINYLTNELNNKVELENTNILDFNIMKSMLDESSLNFKLKALLIPIEFYVEFMGIFSAYGKAKFEFKYGQIKMILDNHQLDVYWSNKYMPIKDVYLIGENALNWCVKKTHDQLQPRLEKFQVCSIPDNDKDIDVIYGKNFNEIYFGARVVVSLTIKEKSVRRFKIKIV